MKLIIVPALVAICGMATPAAAQAPSLDARVSLNVVEADLAQVVQNLRDRSGANIVIIDGSGQKMVRDLQINDVHWRDALDYAVTLADAVVTEDRSGVLVVSSPIPVTFDFGEKDTDIRAIITTIAAVSGSNIIVAPEVTGTLRVRLRNVPWRDALEEVAKTRGYTVVEERRGILRVVDPLTLEKQKVTRSYQLRFVRPRGPRSPRIQSEFIQGGIKKVNTGSVKDQFSVLDALRKALSEQGQLDYIEEQNVIIVRDTVQVHETVQEILNRSSSRSRSVAAASRIASSPTVATPVPTRRPPSAIPS